MEQESQTISKRKLKVKLFNKMYKDMQQNIKIVLKRNNDKVFSVNKLTVVKNFATEMDSYKQLYDNMDVLLLEKVTILNMFFKDKPELSKANKQAVWKYLELLYSIAKEEKKEALKKKEPFNLSTISNAVNSLMTNDSEDNGLKDLIKDISTKLENDIGDKQIDQAKILQDLISGNMNSCGIDFKNIIDESSKNLHKKVESGEIDINKLKDVASKLKNEMNL